ncbi:MAG: hypothetical protein QOJ38_502 [Solirubrobacterales bacterium]|nr:hypothetical protein [Solirubrobacterales bacterium]
MIRRSLAPLLVLLAVAMLSACGGSSRKAAYTPSPLAVQRADIEAKVQARNAIVAIEVYSTDQGGSYAGATPAKLRAIEPKVPASIEVKPTTSGYELKVASANGGNVFSAVKGPAGTTTLTCTTAGKGACPASGRW